MDDTKIISMASSAWIWNSMNKWQMKSEVDAFYLKKIRFREGNVNSSRKFHLSFKSTCVLRWVNDKRLWTLARSLLRSFEGKYWCKLTRLAIAIATEWFVPWIKTNHSLIHTSFRVDTFSLQNWLVLWLERETSTAFVFSIRFIHSYDNDKQGIITKSLSSS